MLKLEILDLNVRVFFFFRYFPNFFSKYEKSYGSYFRYAFRKSTNIPEITKKKFLNPDL